VSPKERQEAALFMIHLIGDLHNPMHMLTNERGGMKMKVLFEGQHSNLHFVWDSKMLRKRIKDDFGGFKEKYFRASSVALTSIFSTETLKASNEAFHVGMIDAWAAEVVRYNCRGVLKYFKGEEISTKYYEQMIILVESLIQKAALRLALIFNTILK
ncbi:phospholipase C/P1 nuclease, partial [Rozella allomycis CSF55]